MKNLIFHLSSILLLLFLSCQKEEIEHPIVYPASTSYGTNILNEFVDTIVFNQAYSLAAELQATDSLKIVMKGDSWSYISAPNGPIGWNYTIFDGDQTFWSQPNVFSCDISIVFDKRKNPQAMKQVVTIDYYEKSDTVPTFTKKLVVVDKAASSIVAVTAYSDFGVNLLFPNVYNQTVKTDSSYSFYFTINSDHNITGYVDLYSTYESKVKDIVVVDETNRSNFTIELMGEDVRYGFESNQKQDFILPVQFTKSGTISAMCRIVDSTQQDAAEPVFFRNIQLKIQ